MCNKLSINVKGVSRYTPQGAFVPCGVCEECRENLRAGWTFRLRAEFEHLQRQKWWFGFLTLTYRDSCIPHIPLRFVKSDFMKKYLDSLRTPLCFSRSDLSKYILDLRQWLIRNYDCMSFNFRESLLSFSTGRIKIISLSSIKSQFLQSQISFYTWSST